MIQLLERIALLVIRCACSAVFFLPLIVTSSTFFPYIFGKIIYFEILVQVAFFFWIFLLCVRRSYAPRFRHPVTAALTGFIAILTLTSVIGVDPWNSFWSSQERMTGVLAFIHFWVWYLMLLSVFQDWKQWRVLFFASLTALIIVAISALGQIFGNPFFGIPISGGRVTGSLGNPIYVGGYGLMSIFFAYILLSRERGIFARCISIVALVSSVFLIFASGSRSVLIAFFLALIVTLLYTISRATSSLLKSAGILFFSGIIGVIIFSGWLHTSPGASWGRNYLPIVLQRSLGGNFIDYDRLELWRIGFRGFLDRPLFGWGLENYNAIYNRYAVPERNNARVQDAFFDRSHNQAVDILALSGMLGFISYLLLCIAVLFSSVHLIGFKEARGKIAGLLMFVAFISYGVQNLTVFDTPVALMLFYALLAFLTHMTSLRRSEEAVYERPLTVRLAVTMIFTLFFVGFSLFFVVVRPLSASTSGIRALRNAQVGNLGLSQEEFRRALRVRSCTQGEIRRALADTALKVASIHGQKGERSIRWITHAIEEMEASISTQPFEIRNYLLLAELYVAGSSYNSDYLSKADTLLVKASLIAPSRVEIVLEMAQIAALSGSLERAHALVSHARTLDPKNEKLSETILRLEKEFASSTLEQASRK